MRRHAWPLLLVLLLAGCDDEGKDLRREQRLYLEQRQQLNEQLIRATAMPQPWTDEQKAFVGRTTEELRQTEAKLLDIAHQLER